MVIEAKTKRYFSFSGKNFMKSKRQVTPPTSILTITTQMVLMLTC